MIDMQWLEMCATAGELMYGYYTVNVLKKMYEGRKGYKASVDELIRSMRELEKEGIVLMQYTPGSLDDTKEGGKTQEDMKQPLPTIDDLNSMMPVVNDFLNSINLRARKGWRPNELFMKMHPNGLTSMPTIMPGSVSAAKSLRGAEAQLKAMGAKLDFSSIDNYVTTGAHGERRVMKVGRNDPCPCGSGKKYKHCHGR